MCRQHDEHSHNIYVTTTTKNRSKTCFKGFKVCSDYGHTAKGGNRLPFLKRFICLVEVHYHKVNLNSDNQIYMSNFHHQPGDFFRTVMAQYCSRWITARWSQSEMWGSALTDHAVKENHVIDWESAMIVEKEREDLARGIKEAIYIRKLPNLNRDEGRYHLSHLYDNLLGAAAHT